MRRLSYIFTLCMAFFLLVACQNPEAPSSTTEENAQSLIDENNYTARYRQEVYEPYLALMEKSDQYLVRAMSTLQGLTEDNNDEIIETLKSVEKDLKAQRKEAKAIKAPSYFSKAQTVQFDAMIEAFIKATDTQTEAFKELRKAIAKGEFGKETKDNYQRSANISEQEGAKAALAFVGLSKAYGIDYTAEQEAKKADTSTAPAVAVEAENKE